MPRKEAPCRSKTGLRLGLIVSAICCFTMSCLILWDGCQEFSLYRHDLRLTSREGRDAAEEALSMLWRQKHTPPGASIRLITQQVLGKQHTHTHMYNTHTPLYSYTSQYLRILWKHISKACQPPPLLIACDRQIKSLNKHGQLHTIHSDVQSHRPLTTMLQLESRMNWILLKSKVKWQSSEYRHLLKCTHGTSSCAWNIIIC